MTSPTPVQLYVLDPTFTNRAIPTPPFFHSAGGIAQLSGNGLAYFVTPYLITDPREPSTRDVAWAPETSASLLVDQTVYPGFLTTLAGATSAASAALFSLIDILAFNYNANTPAATLEALITGSVALVSYYQPGTLAIGPATGIGTVYANNLTTSSFTCPTKISFVFNLTSGGQTLSYAITIWVDNNTFLANYANSTITAVIPPTDWSDLLNLAFASNSATLATDTAAAALAQPLINTAIRTVEPSGYDAYVAKVFDGTAVLSMTFGIVYVGQVPTFAAMRAAILAAVEASGVGTPAQWQVRIPELYVESRIYLIPIWDQKITSGSGTLYSGISTPSTLLSKAATVLGSSAASPLVAQYGQFLTAAYDLMPIVATPDSVSQPSDSLQSLYPTYQAYATTDPSFLYMSADAQAFATMLNVALPVAAGLTTNAAYPIILDGMLSYVSFTQNLTEFCIITQAFYDAQLGVTS